MRLELINYEIEGVAWNQARTAIVDGHYLHISAKRHSETVEEGPDDGHDIPMKIDMQAWPEDRRKKLLAAYQALEDVISAEAYEEYDKLRATAKHADEQIIKVHHARRELAQREADFHATRKAHAEDMAAREKALAAREAALAASVQEAKR